MTYQTSMREMTQDQQKDTVEFVKLGFGDTLQGEKRQSRSPLFRTEAMPVAQAAQVLRQVKTTVQRNFDSEKVSEWLLRHQGDIASVELGREIGPCLYIHPSFGGDQSRAESLMRDAVDSIQPNEYGYHQQHTTPHTGITTQYPNGAIRLAWGPQGS